MAKDDRKVKNGAAKVRRIPLDERVSYRLSLIAKRLDQTLAALHAKKLAISVNNWKIMQTIAFFGPLSATALGCRTSVDPDKITRAVDALVQRGYVSRKNDEVDRRRVVLTLSAKGRRVYDRVDQVAGTLEANVLSVLSAAEHRALLSSLNKLELHSGRMSGQRDAAYERRMLDRGGVATAQRNARPSKRTGRTGTRKLVGAK